MHQQINQDGNIVCGDRAQVANPVARTAIVVVGMHRSGTSAFTRFVSLMGAALPKTLLQPTKDNERGYWEPARIIDLHDQVLANLATSWSDVLSPLPALNASPEAAAALQEKIAAVLREEYGDADLFVVKDPRIPRLLPLWLGALGNIGSSPKFIISIRNVLEVAASLYQRDKIDLQSAALLWLSHILAAEQFTRGYPRVFVSLDLLLSDWRAAATKICSTLSLHVPKLCEIAPDVGAYLSGELRHHKYSARDVEDSPQIPTLVKRIHTLAFNAVEDPSGSFAEWDQAWAAVQHGEALFGPLLRTERTNTNRANDIALNKALECARAQDSVLALTAEFEAREKELLDRTRALEGERSRLEGVVLESRRGLDELRENFVAQAAQHQAEAIALKAAIATLSSEREIIDTRLAIQAEKITALINERGHRSHLARELVENLRLNAVSGTKPTSRLLSIRAALDVAASRLRHVLGYVGITTAMSSKKLGLKQARRLMLYRASPLFDESFYLRMNPDVANAGLDAAWHYDEYGAKENRNPHPLFDTRFYLTTHTDVARSNLNPLFHFLVYGHKEGRRFFPLE